MAEQEDGPVTPYQRITEVAEARRVLLAEVWQLALAGQPLAGMVAWLSVEQRQQVLAACLDLALAVRQAERVRRTAGGRS